MSPVWHWDCQDKAEEPRFRTQGSAGFLGNRVHMGNECVIQGERVGLFRPDKKSFKDLDPICY